MYTTITYLMEILWNKFHEKVVKEGRHRLLKWLSAYIVFALCNQIHISNHLTFYNNFQPILKAVEDKYFELLDHKLEGTKKRSGRAFGVDRVKLCHQDKLCFEPEFIEDYFSSSRDENECRDQKATLLEKEELRNRFCIKQEYQVIIQRVYKSLVEEFYCHKKDELWSRK